MARRARGRGSGDGVDRAVLATGVGGAGAVLETEAPDAAGCEPCLRHTAPCTSAIESGRRRAKTRLSRRGAFGEALGRAGTDSQFCARRRAAALADRDAPQVPDHAQPGAT